MFCEKCGTEIPKGAKFCEKCGAPVEPELQGYKEGDPHKKWIFGGIMGGIFIVAVVVVSLFVTGVLGGKDDVVQTSTDGGIQSDTGVSDVTPQSTATPVITPSPAPEPTETPVEGDESAEEDVVGDPEEEDDLTNDRTPEETYKQYIEAFVEAVNTGNTDGLSPFLSGKVYKQQCDLVENYYKRGIREELQSCSVTSIKQINDNRTKVNAKETIEVFYEDGSSKVVKQKYSYVCEYINPMWMITSMKDVK